MKKLIGSLLLFLPLVGLFHEVKAQSDPVTYNVAWTGKGGGCYCPLNLCLEVCWCDEDPPMSGNCQPGTEACNLDCITTLQPSDFVQFSPLTVNVPSGKLIIMKKLKFSFQCDGEAPQEIEFNLMQPNGNYEFPDFHVKPGCPGLSISLNNGYVMFFTGN